MPIDDVIFIEADDDYIKIHTSEKAYLKKATLTSFENRLPSTMFTRIHRSYLVNITEVTRIEPYEKTSHLAILKKGEKLPVSKSGYQQLKQSLGI